MSEETDEGAFARLEALADEYATAQAMADHLAQFRKSKKALLMKESEVNGTKTAAIQERDAYAHPDYIELLKGLQAATEKALSCKWRLEISKMKFEAWRTRNATKRAEMNLR